MQKQMWHARRLSRAHLKNSANPVDIQRIDRIGIFDTAEHYR